MQNEKLQVNLAPGTAKAELIIREVNTVNELPVKPPVIKVETKPMENNIAGFICKFPFQSVVI